MPSSLRSSSQCGHGEDKRTRHLGYGVARDEGGRGGAEWEPLRGPQTQTWRARGAFLRKRHLHEFQRMRWGEPEGGGVSQKEVQRVPCKETIDAAASRKGEGRGKEEEG